MKAIFILALAASPPALADVYRCISGGKTVYQDTPCANARAVDNINALPLPRAEPSS